MTHDALITGINSSEIRKRLLEERDLHFQADLRKAQMLDQAEKQSGSDKIKLSQTAAVCNFVTSEKSTVLAMQKSTLKGSSSNCTIKQDCYFCGESLLAGRRNYCPVKNKSCNNCGKVGHS